MARTDAGQCGGPGEPGVHPGLEGSPEGDGSCQVGRERDSCRVEEAQPKLLNCIISSV